MIISFCDCPPDPARTPSHSACGGSPISAGLARAVMGLNLRRVNPASHCVACLMQFYRNVKSCQPSQITHRTRPAILYRKGNSQVNKHRCRLTGWQFYELQRQIECKVQRVGLPVKFADPRRTSTQCPKCEKKLQDDVQHRRKMPCGNCGLFMDRDHSRHEHIWQAVPWVWE